MKKIKKRSIIEISVILILACVSGYFIGNLVYQSFYKPKPQFYDYSLYTEQSLRDSVDSLIAQKNKKGVSGFTAVENYLIAEYMISKTDYVVAKTDGVIKAKAVGFNTTQGVQAEKIKNQNIFYKTNLSVGFKKVGERIISQLNTDNQVEFVLQQSGEPDKDYQVAAWNNEVIRYTAEQWGSVNGVHASYFLPWIVSSKTVDSQSGVSKMSNGNYKFEIKLNPLSVLLYRSQMRNISALKDYPQFWSIDIEVEMDSEWRFVSVKSKEKYQAVTGGITADCEGSMTDTFVYGQADKANLAEKDFSSLPNLVISDYTPQ